MKSLKEKVLNYIYECYGAKPEYLWLKFPGYAVTRHSDNKKWFAIIMDVPREKLGLKGKEKVDVINLKMSNMLTVDFLISQPGILKGYHISRGNWISVVLDGTVPFDNIKALIEESFNVTAKKIPLNKAKQNN